jgi:L-seryl-tRNA(Ser) seleniumtransferase
MATPAHSRLRELPSVERLLALDRMQTLLRQFKREFVTRLIREALDELRTTIRGSESFDSDLLTEESILSRIERRLGVQREAGMTRAINATGTVLHTNLGRALLPRPAVDAICRAAVDPVNLEYDLASGQRGRREDRVDQLLVELTGAEAATAVNNNAAAVLVALNTFAAGKEVIVSRGELIEIGGAFRIPEIMQKSGAVLKEVGTTNRTHPSDYEKAITDRTGLLLKVHTSNYKVVGFVADVELPALVAIGKSRGVPVMEDLGSGALLDLSRFGLPKEPVVADRIDAGADVVTFSGDKLLGGPQAGLMVGSQKWIGEIRANPLHRAVRCGKLTLAALEATLALYRESPDIANDIPTLRTLTRPVAELEAMGHQALSALSTALEQEYRLSMLDSTAQIGSGALPTEEIPSKAIVVEHGRMSAQQIAERFRQARPPIIGRIQDGSFLLDLRTIFDPADLVPRWNE